MGTYITFLLVIFDIPFPLMSDPPNVRFLPSNVWFLFSVYHFRPLTSFIINGCSLLWNSVFKVCNVNIKIQKSFEPIVGNSASLPRLKERKILEFNFVGTSCQNPLGYCHNNHLPFSWPKSLYVSHGASYHVVRTTNRCL